MNINWSKLGFRFTRERLLASGALFIFAALFFLYTHYSREQVKSAEDLITIQGKVKDFNFINGNRGYRDYFFHLEGYNKTFKLKADFLKYFDKPYFNNVASAEETLYVELPKNEGSLSELNDGKKAFVFGLYTERQVLLDKQKAIEAHNSHFMIYCSVIFLVVGSIAAYYGYRVKKEFAKESNYS